MSGATKREWEHFAYGLGLITDLLPIAPGEKRPSTLKFDESVQGMAGWQTHAATSDDIDRWSADGRYSIGIVARIIRAIDADITTPELADEIELFVARFLTRNLPKRWRANSSKFLLAFRMPGDFSKCVITCGEDGRIEFLANKQQFLLCGAHPSGVPYQWDGGLPEEFPELSAEEFEELWQALSDKFGIEATKAAPTEALRPDRPALTEISGADLVRLRDALAYEPLLASLGDNDSWSDLGHNLLTLGALGCELFAELSRKAPNYQTGDAERFFETHASTVPTTDYTHALVKARALGWRGDIEFDPIATEPGAPPAPPAAIGEVPDAHHTCTDLANANRLRDSNRGLLVVHSGAFLAWTGTHWTRDETIARRQGAKLSDLVHAEIEGYQQKLKTLEARLSPDVAEQYNELQQLARPERTKLYRDFAANSTGAEILRVTATIAALRKWAVECESEARINSALRLLKGMLNAPTEQFDRHPHLFNVMNGTIDLRMGKLKPHDPADFITQLAPVTYDPAAEAPLFRKSVLEIMNDDPQLAAFMQRYLGYSITGETNEQKWGLCTGEGANGKGVFYQTLERVLGTYAHTVPASLLVVKGSENRHPTEIADLYGPRLVLASETEDGAHLREAMLKNITGQDELSGRYMYKDHFTFVPRFKLHLQTNKKPVIKGQENATWRRILLIEFKVIFGTAEDVAAGKAHKIRDNNLCNKLLPEASGILNWLIEGAMSWYANGLQPPASVINSGKRYQSEQDQVGEFVRACCILDAEAWSPYTGQFGALYTTYTRWIKDSDSRPIGKSQFIAELARVVPNFRKHERKITIDKVRRTFDGAFGLRIDLDDGGGEVVSSNEDLL